MKKKILVVDDAEETVHLIREILEEQGYDVVSASDGSEGLEKAREERLSLIIADVLMPEMDGYAFFKELRHDLRLAQIPVIILTARGKMEDSFRAVGANGFITKPFNADQLLDEVERQLGVKGERRAEAESTPAETEQPFVAPSFGDEPEDAGPAPAEKLAFILGQDQGIMADMKAQLKTLHCFAIICRDAREMIGRFERETPVLIFLELAPDSPVPIEHVLDDLQAIQKVKPENVYQQKPATEIVLYKGHARDGVGAAAGESHFSAEAVLEKCAEIGFSKYIGDYSSVTFKIKIREFLPS